MSARAFLFLLALLLWPHIASAQIAGTYDVEGDHPDRNLVYRGTVSVRQTSTATYEVTWVVNGDRFVGTGIGDERAIAIAYSGPATGVALFRPNGPKEWIGLWTPLGASIVGNETWRRR